MKMYSFIGDITLPYYMKAQIETRNGSKYVIIHSRMHVIKAKELPVCFSSEFTDLEILRDRQVVNKYISCYGV